MEAAEEAAGALEGASPTKDDDEQGGDGSDGSDAPEDDGADGDASPAGDHDGTDGSGKSEDEFAFLEDLVAHARSLNVDDDSRAPGSSKRRLDFTDDDDDDDDEDDDDDDGRDIKKDSLCVCMHMLLYYMISLIDIGSLQEEEKKDGPEFVPSSFRVSGLPAADINKVQKAALESVNHPILTPQEQLDIIKNERAKKAASAPKKGPAMLGRNRSAVCRGTKKVHSKTGSN